MTHSSLLRLIRYTAGAVLLLLFIGCGGSSGLDEGVEEGGGGVWVPPFPGTWTSDAGDEIEFMSPGHDEQYFSTNYEVTARIRDATDACAIPIDNDKGYDLEGTLFGNELTLFTVDSARDTVCMSGTFIDAITLDATLSDGTQRTYRGVRVQFNLNRDNGIWVSDDGGKTRVIFIDPNSVGNNFAQTVRACVISRDLNFFLDIEDENGMIDFEVVRISGQLQGYQTQDDIPPRIDSLNELESRMPFFTDITFIGSNTLSGMNADGEPVTLHRVPTPFGSDLFSICRDSDFP